MINFANVFSHLIVDMLEPQARAGHRMQKRCMQEGIRQDLCTALLILLIPCLIPHLVEYFSSGCLLWSQADVSLDPMSFTASFNLERPLSSGVGEAVVLGNRKLHCRPPS